ncbi:MAG TPA: hypothetical protein VJI75_00105 [Candidatus Nanoarchaeia archaeon]|nr:hypothetical protein [Candidatus Nanoarchaeia archaeon]
MEFNIEKQEPANKEKYSKEEFDVAYKFSEKAYKEFGTFIKAIVLFGSSTRKDVVEGDVDILIIIDDVSLTIKSELVETYRILIRKMVSEISPRLHITTLKLTSFWDFIRQSDPLAVNILRDGFSIIDTGFFDPLQVLLKQGRIRPTEEAIWNYFVRAPATLQNSRWHLLQAALDLYWASLDACHAALMRKGEIPPTPEKVPEMMIALLVKKKVVSGRYADIMQEMYDLSRKILHREIREVTAEEYDRLYRNARDLVNEMQEIVEKKK